MSADRVLQVRFIGNTSDLAGNIDGVSGKFGVLAKGVAAAGAAVGVGLLAAGKGLLDIGATFDAVSDTIRTQTGATGAALDGLVDVAKTVGSEVPSNFADVGTAVAGLNQRLGVTGPHLEGLSMQVLDLSRLTGTDLQQNIEGVTRVFGDWGIQTADQSTAMDKMFTASQATGVSITTLQENLVKFGAPLRQLGFSFEQSAALLGKFEKEGVNTELVMGSMRIALGKLAKQGKEPVAAFREMTERIKSAGDAGTANKLALELFGAKAGPDMAAAIREGRFAIDDLVNTISNSEGSIQSAADDTADFAEQWQVLKNKVFVALEPVAARVFGMINEKMNQLSTWFNENQAAIQGFVAGVGTGFGMLLTAVGTIVGAAVSLGLAIASVVSWIRDHWVVAMLVAIPILLLFGPYFAALGVAATINMTKVAVAWVTSTATAVGSAAAQSLAMLGTAAKFAWMGAQALIHGARVAAGWVLAMGPVGWVIAGVIGLVALIVANWDTVKEWTGKAWDFVGSKIGGTIDWVGGKVSGGVNFIKGVLAWFGNLPGMFRGWWDGAVRATADMINVLLRWVGDIPGRIWGALGNLGSMLWDSGASLVSGFWDGIKARWNQMVDWVRRGMANLRALWPFSPAKEGPFSGRGYVTHSGKALTTDFAASIRKGMPGVVSAVRGVVGAAQGGFSASIADVVPTSRTAAGGAASALAAREVAVKFVGDADQAVATLVMQLIRSGKIQLTA